MLGVGGGLIRNGVCACVRACVRIMKLTQYPGEGSPVVQEEKIFNFRECVFAILLLYLLYYFAIIVIEKDTALHYEKRKSHRPTNSLCQIWLKLSHGLW